MGVGHFQANNLALWYEVPHAHTTVNYPHLVVENIGESPMTKPVTDKPTPQSHSFHVFLVSLHRNHRVQNVVKVCKTTSHSILV